MQTSLKPRRSEKQEFELLPEDIYEVKIISIEDKEREKYQSEEKETVMQFIFEIVEGEFKGRKLWEFATQSLFGGATGLNASKLYLILCAAYEKSYTEEQLSEITTESVNRLEGKNLRVVVKQTINSKCDKRNKIAVYLRTKTANNIPIIENETHGFATSPNENEVNNRFSVAAEEERN